MSVSPLQSDVFLREPAYIDGLPENLRQVPNDPDVWRKWRDAVMKYRIKVRRDCQNNIPNQRAEWIKCKRDTAYFITVWGVIFEPRTADGDPPAWKPFILFPFQVQMVRWVEEVLQTQDKGRGDGIVEKSRDMGATNMMCAIAVKHFLFDKVFVCGFLSKKFEDVDKKIGTGTIFYKLRSLLGAEDAVPADLRLPRWLQPLGFNADIHITTGGIVNPEKGKTCFLVGETTTQLSGVSDRNTMRVVDEAARFDEFESSWANQQATTDHRFAVSSADSSHGLAFKNMADLGRECLINPEKDGPSLLRLEWNLHPFHTPEWFEYQRSRARSNGDPNEFAREYEIDYNANRGAKVYPRAMDIAAQPLEYLPYGGQVYGLIDPWARDPGAIVLCQQEVETGYYNIIDSFEGMPNDDVRLYASMVTGTYVSGYDYDQYTNAHEFIRLMQSVVHQIVWIGDPAGNQNHVGNDKVTWYQELQRAAIELSGKSIYVNTLTAGDARSYEVRKQAINAVMNRMRFNTSQGGIRALQCLREAQYSKPRLSGRRESLEPAKPLHDQYSHVRTALEYGAVWWHRMVNPQRANMGQNQRTPVRVSLSGNVVSGRQREMFEKVGGKKKR